MKTTEFGQRAIEEVAVRKVARQRGVAATAIAFALSIPVGVLVMGGVIPGAAITGLFIGPVVGLMPACIIGGLVQLRYIRRWKKAQRGLV